MRPYISIDLSDEFDIVYESPNEAQTVSMEYDDPDSSVSLDRTDYPKNTGVGITLNDQAMNVDPTSEDTWFLRTGEAPYYGDITNIETRATADAKLAEDLKRAAEDLVTDLGKAKTVAEAKLGEEENKKQTTR